VYTVRSGTPPGQLYARVAADNRAAAEANKKHTEDAEDEAASRVVYKVPVGKAPVLGSSSALVTVIEFADFQCPFCARVEDTLRALRTKYGDKLRLVWRNEPLPFHQAAEGAAEAAVEVRAEKGDAAFWAMHDRLFAAQKGLVANGGPNVDLIADLAAAVGADRGRVKAAIGQRAHAKEIEADAEVAEDFTASGTPHFFVNGRRIVGAQPQEKFEKVIDEAIGDAQALLAKGVKPADLYAALTKDGVGVSEPEWRDLPKGLPSGDPALGSRGAGVTLHEWADFQCPFSGRVEPTVQQILKEYAGRVRLVWHDLPLPMHANARPAAEAAREAYAQQGAAGFWAMHDKLFAEQSHLQRSDLDTYATELHLDASAWAAALDGESHRAEIEADEKAASDARIVGTPAFLVVAGNANRGYWISGAQDYRKFRKLIERSLAQP
jgi:protein-disulfide isomerase